ncbi:tetratricopeptide repeat protein 7B-like isoform X1 [Penaeus japonicus]|uniref:tetratricopeptide repeat protein 7B-like isoform X1 n=1 Tax=Penaeus japonicus TaxID=27405 RepID=UPI001C70B03A|nr:tetratricopeptide repeat protein 7B-like isoform X1 [Penaeus japonicus]
MSSKANRANRLEAEIERSREESNWKKVIELAEHLKSRNQTGLETLANFLIGEGKLESYLEENPPTEANVHRAKSGLSDARRFLLMCIGEPAKKLEVSLDALLLLAKLEYAMGDYEGALNRLTAAGLDQLTEKALPTRSLRIVAESYAIKGLCSAPQPRKSLGLEKAPLPNNSKFQRAEKVEKMIRCFELAGDLTLLYLQEQDKLTSTPSTHSLYSVPSVSTTNTTGSTSPLPPNGLESKKIGVILETALQRAPILHMKAGQLDKAISRYRSMLSAVESTATQHLRLTLARQLAEVLLRGCSEHAYKAPNQGMRKLDERSRSSSSLKSGESPWKPQKYTGTNLFVPKNINEEIILLLLISEAMAVREAVLSQSPEFKNARVHAYDNATAVYDLLCISLARRKQHQILIEVFERAMKFSYEAGHVWQQFGLALACGRKYARALLVLQEVHRLMPSEPHYCLMAAKICFQQLGKIEEGLEWVDKALRSAEERASVLTARCYLYHGLGLTLEAHHKQRHADSQALRAKALESFVRAQQLDSSDHLVEFYLALHYAQSRHLVEATHHVKLALYLRSEHPHSLHLLILLLSAQKEYEEALELVEAALAEYPENLHLLYVRASLEEAVHGGEVALLTARHMLSLWQTLYKDQLMGDISDVQSQMHTNHDTYSIFNMSDKDGASVHAESVAASRVEQALSEVASSLSSYQPKPGPQQAWLLQIQIWLLTAQLYLKTDQVNEAAQCLQEASSIFPMSHHILFMKGLLHEKKNEFYEAQTCYQNALAINPYHLKSLRHLGQVYHYLGSDRLAEKTLLDAIKVEPHDHHSWEILGEVMVSLGQLDASSKCLATSIEIEAKAPILPFTSIPFCYE